MHRPRTAWLLAGVLAVFGRIPVAAGQATSIPLSLSVTISPPEIAAGEAADVQVRLRNFRGDVIPAVENLTVTLHSELVGDTTLSFAPGHLLAHAAVRFPRPGIATLVASAPNLTSSTATLVIDAGGGHVTAAPSAPAAAVPSANGASDGFSSSVILSVDVLPDHIHPTNASWQAKVLVTAMNDKRQPMELPGRTTIQLATDAGEVSPAVVTIEKGHARITEPVLLTSSKPGAGTVWAWTDSGAMGQATFAYHDASPTQVAVKAVPMRTLNDGRTAIRVSVFLEDDTSMATKAETETQVKLIASVGTPNPSVVVIPKGQFVGETLLTSATAGTSEITATAPGMKPAVADVEFVFPYALVLMAALGGLVGALVRSSVIASGEAWGWHLLGSLAIGAILGLFFYLLAAFGVIASIPTLPLRVQALPTTNEFAALVLGFLGGYFARTWLPNPDQTGVSDSAVHRSGAVRASPIGR